MSKKRADQNQKRLIMTAKILLAFVLSVICFGVVLNVGDSLKAPVTPCFYMGRTEELQPAYPCINAISWQAYQFVMVGIIAALTYGIYRMFNVIPKH